MSNYSIGTKTTFSLLDLQTSTSNSAVNDQIGPVSQSENPTKFSNETGANPVQCFFSMLPIIAPPVTITHNQFPPDYEPGGLNALLEVDANQNQSLHVIKTKLEILRQKAVMLFKQAAAAA